MVEAVPSLCRIWFIDIVGFSKKPSQNQKTLIQELTRMVENTAAVKEIDKSCRVALPTGDGMALVLWCDSQLVLSAALQLDRRLKEYNCSCSSELKIEVRTGIHSGEVFTLVDINQQRNIVGEGINNAQRVMDFGNAGHILAGRSIVDELLNVVPGSASLLHDAGFFADKHGIQHQIFNVFDYQCGNPEAPTKNRVVASQSGSNIDQHIWKRLIDAARLECQLTGKQQIVALHLFLALTAIPQSRTRSMIEQLGIDLSQLRRGSGQPVQKSEGGPAQQNIQLSEEAMAVAAAAWQRATDGSRDVTEEDFLWALFNFSGSENLENLLKSSGISVSELKKAMILSEKHAMPAGFNQENCTASAAVTEAVSVASGASFRVVLTVESEIGRGREFEFNEPEVFIVGRSPEANFVLDQADKSVSRKHFLIEIAPPKCYIRDFASMNGTLVNGRKVDRGELHDGDVITAGKTRLKVSVQNIAGSASACGRCGGFYAEDRLSGSAKICVACLEELELEEEGKMQKTRVPASEFCAQCQKNVSSEAVSDGRALALHGLAEYICPDCLHQKIVGRSVPSICAFSLIEELGQGGMGRVFLAWNSQTCRLGALKMVSLPEADERTALRFNREMRIMSELVSPYLVKIFETGVANGNPFFVAEYFAAGSLSSLLQKSGGIIAGPTALNIALDMLLGLEFLHASGHIHRDIKPANILLKKEPDGIIKARIGDFGLARSFVGAGGTRLTKAGEFAGSIYYTAPEQIVDFSGVGPAADVYSAGVTLYQMLCGALPHDFASSSGMRGMKDSLLTILEEPVIPIRERRSDISSALAVVVNKSLARHPQERYQSAAEFREALLACRSSI